jgi:hypothetical protein
MRSRYCLAVRRDHSDLPRSFVFEMCDGFSRMWTFGRAIILARSFEAGLGKGVQGALVGSWQK